MPPHCQHPGWLACRGAGEAAARQLHVHAQEGVHSSGTETSQRARWSACRQGWRRRRLLNPDRRWEHSGRQEQQVLRHCHPQCDWREERRRDNGYQTHDLRPVRVSGAPSRTNAWRGCNGMSVCEFRLTALALVTGGSQHSSAISLEIMKMPTNQSKSRAGNAGDEIERAPLSDHWTTFTGAVLAAGLEHRVVILSNVHCAVRSPL